MHFLRASTIYALANVASAAVPFVLLPMLTRMLGPAEYGAVVAFSLWSTLALPLAGMSVHGAIGVTWFQRDRSQANEYAGSAIALTCLCTVAIAALAAPLVLAWPALGVGLTPPWAALSVVSAGATVLLQCRLVLWQSQQRPVSNACMQIGASVLNVGLSLVAVLLLGWGGDGRNAAIACSALIMAVLAIASMQRAGDARWAPRREHFSSLLAFGLPLVPHAIAGALLVTADRWLVANKLGVEALGIYGAAAQLGMVMSVLADAFVKAYNPWLYARLGSAEARDRDCVVGAIYAGVPAFGALALILAAVLLWASTTLLGPLYQSASSILGWFVLGGAFSGIYYSISALFFFYRRTGWLAMASVTAALLCMPLVWWLIGRHGVRGAAMGFACSQILLTAAAAAIAVRRFPLPWHRPAAAVSTWVQCATGRHSTRAA
jgi:O-antigen/teichoic acid export membrane protein